MNTLLPTGFCWRAPTVADAQAIVDLVCQIDTFDYGEPSGGAMAFNKTGMRG